MRSTKYGKAASYSSRIALYAILLLMIGGSAFAQGASDLPGIESDDLFIDTEVSEPEITESSDEVADSSLKYADQPGFIIKDVFTGSPADKAGLLRGDIILALDGTEVLTIADVQELLNGYSHGDAVELLVSRGGEELTIELNLETRVGYPLIGIVGTAGGGFGRGYAVPGNNMNGRTPGNGFGLPYMDDDRFGMGRMYGFDDNLDDADDLDIPEEILGAVIGGHTAYIAEVVEGGPADEAGIKADTIIAAVNDVLLDEGDLAGAILECEIGETVSLTVGSLTDGIYTVEVELGENDGNPFLGVSYYPFTIMNGNMNMAPGSNVPWGSQGKGMFPNFTLPEAEDN